MNIYDKQNNRERILRNLEDEYSFSNVQRYLNNPDVKKYNERHRNQFYGYPSIICVSDLLDEYDYNKQDSIPLNMTYKNGALEALELTNRQVNEYGKMQITPFIFYNKPTHKFVTLTWKDLIYRLGEMEKEVFYWTKREVEDEKERIIEAERAKRKWTW